MRLLASYSALFIRTQQKELLHFRHKNRFIFNGVLFEGMKKFLSALFSGKTQTRKRLIFTTFTGSILQFKDEKEDNWFFAAGIALDIRSEVRL